MSTGDRKRDSRRAFLAKAAMGGGLAAGYGTCAVYGGAFLYPASEQPHEWMFVAETAAFPTGTSRTYTSPRGEPITIARNGSDGGVEDFIALSSTCPHLGCQVYWQAENERFFCPCHNGVFDASGKGISGPPGKAGQSLSQYRLRIDSDLLYIEVPSPEESEATAGLSRPGHDRCVASPQNEEPKERKG